MPPRGELRRSELRSARRFLLVGGANTAVTWGVFALLAKVLDPRIAYTIVFAAGVAFTTVATGRWVFEAAAPSAKRSLVFAVWYLAMYGVGLALVDVLARRGDMPEELLALAVVAVIAPLNFIGGRLVFRDHGPDA